MSPAVCIDVTLGQNEYFGINTKSLLKNNILWLLYFYYIKQIFFTHSGISN